MKSRDGLLVLMVIGVVGALSFVAYRYGLDTPQTAVLEAEVEVADATISLPRTPKDLGALKDRPASNTSASEEAEQSPETEPPVSDAATASDPDLDLDPNAETEVAAEAETGVERAPSDVTASFDEGDPEIPALAAEEELPRAEAPSAALDAVAPPQIREDSSLDRRADEEVAPSVIAAPSEAQPAGADGQAEVAALPSTPEAPEAETVSSGPASPPSMAGAVSPSIDMTSPSADSESQPAVVAAVEPGSMGGVRQPGSPKSPDGATRPAASPNVSGPEDANDPKSYPAEPGRGFVTKETERPDAVGAPGPTREALGAPMVDGSEDPQAASRDVETSPPVTPEDPVAKAAREGDAAFETPHSPEPPEAANSSAEDVRRPSLDIVRVESDGSGILAGRAEPGALVTVLVDGAPSQEVLADSGGEFVVLMEPPAVRRASIRIDLRAMSEGGAVVESLEPVIVTLPADPARAPVVVKATPEGVQMLGPPQPKADDGHVVIQTVTYGTQGEVLISGSGAPGEVARVYLDNGLAAEARVSPDGQWRVKLAKEVPPAVYTLRVDQMTSSGIVTSRAETPFERARIDLVLREGTVIVQPGNNLWKIAENVYGAGERYTIIYDSNRDQIRDPNLIYPGQILDLPEEGILQQ